MNTITIDCGASFIKGALFCDGVIVKRKEISTPQIKNDQNILITKHINNLLAIVKQLILLLADGISEFKICICNEMHGFLLATSDGKTFTDYISWQQILVDAQVSMELSPLKKLKDKKYRKDILHTGMPLLANLPSCNLLYLTTSKALENASVPLYFYTLGDYIIRALFQVEPICHPTNAAATGLYDIESGNWNDNLIQAVSEGKNIIFPIIGDKIVYGKLEGKKAYIYPAIGDQQAALLGSGLRTQSAISFNLGTGAQVSRFVLTPEFAEKWQIRPYFYRGYIKTIPHLPCGRALNVYIRFFSDLIKKIDKSISSDQIWNILMEAEKSTLGGDLQCDLSFFENASTDYSHGSITNIGEYSLTAGNLMRAAFEQMVHNFVDAADKIYPEKEFVEEIILSGGISRKIETISKGIANHYGNRNNLKVTVSSDETLHGLYFYKLLSEQKGMD